MDQVYLKLATAQKGRKVTKQKTEVLPKRLVGTSTAMHSAQRQGEHISMCICAPRSSLTARGSTIFGGFLDFMRRDASPRSSPPALLGDWVASPDVPPESRGVYHAEGDEERGGFIYMQHCFCAARGEYMGIYHSAALLSCNVFEHGGAADRLSSRYSLRPPTASLSLLHIQ